MAYSIAVIGIGKISEDQHLPVIAKNDDFELTAVVSSSGKQVEGVPSFRTPAELYAAQPDLDAVAICTPPGPRHKYVIDALDAGKHVLMEKPPMATVSEYDDVVAHAADKGKVLFATWHSQFNEAVDRVRDMLAKTGVKKAHISWKESVRKWHPGQDWVWEPGGFGVCDPGINALSIFTKIMPFPVFVQSATLACPSNKQTPVDVQMIFKGGPNTPALTGHFNWLEESGEIWTIAIETGDGKKLELEKGGAALRIDGETVIDNTPTEYEQIYAHFADLLKSGRSDTDGAPLRLMSDIFFLGRREDTDPFEW